MKKQLFKALAATAIVGAVMAMSSVVASAAPKIYNFSETTNPDVKAINYDDKATSYFADKGEFDLFGSENIVVDGKLKPQLVDYTNIETDYAGKDDLKEYIKYFSNPASEGTLSGTPFTRSLVATSSGDGTKVFVTLKNISNGDKIEIYYVGADSKGAPGKASGLVVSGSGINKTFYTAAGTPSTADINYVTVNATANGSVTISPTKDEASKSSRVAIAAIVVTSADATEEIGTELTEVANGAVIAVGSDTYIIAAVAKDSEKMDQESITISLPNGTFEPVPTTSKVYETISVNGEDLSLDTNNYYYAIKVTGSKDIKLKDFTVE